MDFREELKKIIESVRGGIAAMLVGTDGIPVEFYSSAPDRVDTEEIGAELSALLQHITVMVANTGIGKMEHFWIVTDSYKLLAAPLTDEYFVMLILEKSGFVGQGIFKLKTQVAAIEEEII